MNNITVTVELCAEDRARLDKILAALTEHDCSKCVDAAVKYTAASVGPFQPVAAPEKPEPLPAEPEPEAVNTPEPEKPAEPEKQPEEQPQVTHADIQRKVVDLSSAGKKAEVREIVTAYAVKVSAIPADKCNEVWDKLTALEG